MVKVRKVYGEFPEVVVVLAQEVAFDTKGFAEVEDEAADVLRYVPGYEVYADVEPASEDQEEAAPAAPKKPRPAPRTKPKG